MAAAGRHQIDAEGAGRAQRLNPLQQRQRAAAAATDAVPRRCPGACWHADGLMGRTWLVQGCCSATPAAAAAAAADDGGLVETLIVVTPVCGHALCTRAMMHWLDWHTHAVFGTQDCEAGAAVEGAGSGCCADVAAAEGATGR